MKILIRIWLLLLFFGQLFPLYAISDSIADNRPKVGLVLSGGGAKGFAHIGVLKVLEANDIKIDYIAGTSMGAIIGAFYAMGYSAVEIENIAKTQNWNDVFSGKVNREYVPLYERTESDRYILSFPMGKKGIELPDGIVRKKNVLAQLSKITKQYNTYIDFKKDLPIPFVCIAYDLETGEEVVLDKGNFPQSIYASMAIPTVFTPIEIDNRILVDGGLGNNFPVNRVKEMGAEIVIGVDVQYGLRKRHEMQNIENILNQIIGLVSIQDSSQIEACDYYIKPGIKEFTIRDFSKTEELILSGEQAALAVLPKIVNLRHKRTLQKQKLHSPDFFIKDIQVKGLSNFSSEQFKKRLSVSLPKIFTEEEIEKVVKKVYEHFNLDFLNYNFEGDNNEILVFHVKEKNGKTFNVGVHFDQDQGSAVLLNTSFYNVLFNHSKLSLDGIVSLNPRFTMKYKIDNGNIPSLNFTADINNFVYKFNNEKNKILSGEFTSIKLDANTRLLFKNSYSLGIGARFDYYDVNLDYNLISDFISKDNDYFGNYYAFIELNTFDDNYYPKHGSSLYGEYKFVNNSTLEDKASIAYFEVQKAFSISEKLVLIPAFYGRSIISSNAPDVYKNFLTGQNKSDFYDHSIPFVGSKFYQLCKDNVFVLGLDARIELWRNNYLIAKGNIGTGLEDVADFDDGDLLVGGGLTFSYNSIIGPIEVSLTLSNIRNKVSSYFNVGFWF